MPSYSQNKTHIYNWCANNIEHSREIKRRWKQKNDAKKKLWKEIQKEFFAILLF